MCKPATAFVMEPHRDRPLSERESRRWVETAERAKEVLASAAMVTVVADRESDMYPAWASVPRPGFHLLSRAMVDRRLAGGGTRFSAAESFTVAGRRKIKLPARQPDRAARTATVEVRYGEVEICRPRDERDHSLAKTVRLRLVEVREVDPPEGVEPLLWRLLTTHDVADAEKAWQIVGWYQARWTIEQLFRVTKSQGLQLEDSQLASADRLVKLATVAIKAACIDIQLVQERDGTHQSPASTVFAEPEVETLSKRSFRPWRETPSGRRTPTCLEALPARAGSSPGSAVGTAITNPRGRLRSGGGWSSSRQSTAAGSFK
jgi:hypothetical protein